MRAEINPTVYLEPMTSLDFCIKYVKSEKFKYLYMQPRVVDPDHDYRDPDPASVGTFMYISIREAAIKKLTPPHLLVMVWP